MHEKDLNPKFPYKIEKAHWYLLFLWMEHILTEEEFNRAMDRLMELKIAKKTSHIIGDGKCVFKVGQ